MQPVQIVAVEGSGEHGSVGGLAASHGHVGPLTMPDGDTMPRKIDLAKKVEKAWQYLRRCLVDLQLAIGLTPHAILFAGKGIDRMQ